MLRPLTVINNFDVLEIIEYLFQSTEQLNSTKKEKSAEEKGESVEIESAKSEILMKRKRNAEKGTRTPELILISDLRFRFIQTKINI